MAIQSNFDLNRANSSQSYAYQCWYNYNYGGNTMNISRTDMNEITSTWSGELTNWKANAEDDENKYEIEDDDFASAKRNGASQASEAAGYGGGKSYGSVLDAGLAGFGAFGGKLVANGIKGGLKKMGVKLATKEAANGTKQIIGSGEITSEKGNTKLSDIATVVMASAVAAKYWIAKPNKEQKEACDELQNVMQDSQNALVAAQDDMANMQEELLELTEEASVANEDANEDIEDQKAEYDVYKSSYEALMAKVEAGEPLSEDEKSLLQELVPLMQELGVGIETTVSDSGDLVGDIYDDMGTYQEGYDNSAETVAEVQGVTDFAEGFDTNTQTMCYVEAAAQGINAGSATTAAIKLLSKPLIGKIFAGIGIAAAASSTAGGAQQVDWAGDVGKEISMRKATQDMNTETNDIYEESIDNYAAQMGEVENLEVIVPDEDEMEIPEEVPVVPTASGDNTAASSAFGVSSQDDKEADKKDKKA